MYCRLTALLFVVVGSTAGCSSEGKASISLAGDASSGTGGSAGSPIAMAGNGSAGTPAVHDAGIGDPADTGPPAAGTYRWYPRLELDRIPFHAGAGEWGAHEPITAPEPPNVTDPRTYEIRSGADFTANVGAGRLLVVKSGARIEEDLSSEVSDLDILIEDGARIRQIYVNAGSRIRFRGAVSGQHNTGRIDNIDFGNAAPVTDVIIDGLDAHPIDEPKAFLAAAVNPVTRMSVTHMRVRGGIGLLVGTVDAVFAASNFINESGMWIMRNEKVWRRIVFFEVHMENFGQPIVRAHGSDVPGMNSGAFWIGDSTLVQSSQRFPEATGFCVRIGGAGSGLNTVVDSFFMDNVRVHAQGMLGSEVGPGPGTCNYYRVEGGQIVSDDFDPNLIESLADPDQDWLINAPVLPSASNPVPDWTDRSETGNPLEIE